MLRSLRVSSVARTSGGQGSIQLHMHLRVRRVREDWPDPPLRNDPWRLLESHRSEGNELRMKTQDHGRMKRNIGGLIERDFFNSSTKP